MATKYWVGGGASHNWNATSSTNWSNTDGGSNNATAPRFGACLDAIATAGDAINSNTAAAATYATCSNPAVIAIEEELLRIASLVGDYFRGT